MLESAQLSAWSQRRFEPRTVPAGEVPAPCAGDAGEAVRTRRGTDPIVQPGATSWAIHDALGTASPSRGRTRRYQARLRHEQGMGEEAGAVNESNNE